MKRNHILCSLALFGFLLGVYKGKIAIWHNEDPQPLKVFPYYAHMLPEADRLALEEGIRFESVNDLKRLIADYMS